MIFSGNFVSYDAAFKCIYVIVLMPVYIHSVLIQSSRNNVVWERCVDSIVESCAVCCSAAVFYQCNGVRRQPTLDVLVKFSPENALLHETSLQISFLWKMMLHAFRQIHLVFKILKLRQLGDTAPLWEEWDWEKKGYIQENKWQYILLQLPIRIVALAILLKGPRGL